MEREVGGRTDGPCCCHKNTTNISRPLDAKVQGSTPARAEIWIEISAPCASLFHLWDHNIGYQSKIFWKLG